MTLNEHGMPIYLEIHKGHRSGHLNFGVMIGLIANFSLEQMQEFRQTCCVVIGIAEDAFRRGNEIRNPAANAIRVDAPMRPILGGGKDEALQS